MQKEYLKGLTSEENERFFFLGECLIVNGELVVGEHNQDLWQEFNMLSKKYTNHIVKVIAETDPYNPKW
jgi:hypothetical protein